MKVITLYIWIICWTINEACIVVPQQKCLENELNYYEHETDCSSYYLCDNGVLTTYSCPIGLYYNNGVKKIRTCTNNKYYSPTLQYCEVPEVAYCPICYPVRTTPPPLEPTCPAIPSCSPLEHGKTKPYPPQCSKYIYCNSNGDEIIRLCPNGFHYSTESNYCVHPDIAKCIACVLDGTEVTTLEPIAVNCKEFPSCADYYPGVMLPYGLDCRKYIYCDNNGTPDFPQLLLLTQPIFVHRFQFVMKMKSGYSNRIRPIAAKPSTTEIDTTPTISNLTSNPDSTLTYSDTTFALETSSTTIDTTPNNDNTTSSDSITSPSITTTALPLPPCQPQPVCKPNDNNNRLPYPPECTMYIKCKKSSPHEYWMCPEGKEFSPITNWCEFPLVANCTKCDSDGTLPPVEGTETPPIKANTQPYFSYLNIGTYYKSRNLRIRGVESMMELDRN
ncbi:hypothetical protein B566_EDAN015948 [Ephemera danica]|nr:hypothetical protein B566_EDAN015948 [Ephemera danica]